jgi:hypothetical protein
MNSSLRARKPVNYKLNNTYKKRASVHATLVNVGLEDEEFNVPTQQTFNFSIDTKDDDLPATVEFSGPSKLINKVITSGVVASLITSHINEAVSEDRQKRLDDFHLELENDTDETAEENVDETAQENVDEEEPFEKMPPLGIHPSKLHTNPSPIPIDDRRFPNLRGEDFFALVDNLPYQRINTFDTDESADAFFRLTFPRCTKGKSEWRSCGECDRGCGHRMRYSIRNCSCSQKACIIQFKIQKCESSGLIEVYQRGHDIHNHQEMLIGKDNSTKKAKIIANGIHIGYKKLILSYLDDVRVTLNRVSLLLIF